MLLARAWQLNGRVELATELLKRVTQQNIQLSKAVASARDVAMSGDPQGRYRIATAYLRCGLHEEAGIWLKSVLQIDPDHEPARQALQTVGIGPPRSGT